MDTLRWQAGMRDMNRWWQVRPGSHVIRGPIPENAHNKIGREHLHKSSHSTAVAVQCLDPILASNRVDANK